MMMFDFKNNIYNNFISFITNFNNKIFNYFDNFMISNKRKYFVYSKGSETPYLIKYNVLFNNNSAPFNIMLHKFIDNDKDTNLHDHDRDYYTINLLGSYHETEFVYNKEKKIIGRVKNIVNNNLNFLNPKYSHATHCHSISLVNNKPCWLMLINFKKYREAGFWVKKNTENNQEYNWESFKDYYGKHKYCECVV